MKTLARITPKKVRRPVDTVGPDTLLLDLRNVAKPTAQPSERPDQPLVDPAFIASLAHWT